MCPRKNGNLAAPHVGSYAHRVTPWHPPDDGGVKSLSRSIQGAMRGLSWPCSTYAFGSTDDSTHRDRLEEAPLDQLDSLRDPDWHDAVQRINEAPPDPADRGVH